MSKPKRRQHHLSYQHRLFAFAIACINQTWLPTHSSAQECFPEDQSYMPFVLVKDDGTGQPAQDHEEYQSIVGNDNYVIAGGTTKTDSLNQLSQTEAAVITRIDLASHVHRWSRTYHVEGDGSKASNVLGMALNNDSDKVAVWVTKDEQGYESGYLFTISALDGGHVSLQATKVKHSSGHIRKFLTSSAAMYYPSYGQVVIAWYLNMNDANVTPFDVDTTTPYDGRIRVGSYMADSSQANYGEFGWILEQNNYFGHATSIAYSERGPLASDLNIYIGGAVDIARKNGASSAAEDWQPSIYHRKMDGSQEKYYTIPIGWAASPSPQSHGDHATIDHLKFHLSDANVAKNYLYGTTRSHLLSGSATGTGNQIHIFGHEIQDDGSPFAAANKFAINKLTWTAPSLNTYVTGISNTIEQQAVPDIIFHLTMFDPDTEKLWYYKTGETKALLIQDNITSIRETVFAGILTGILKESSGGASHNYIMQSYSVGKSTSLDYWGDPATKTPAATFGSGTGPMAIIIPTLQEQNCLQSAKENFAVTLQDVADITGGANEAKKFTAVEFSPDDMDDTMEKDNTGTPTTFKLNEIKPIAINDLKVADLVKNTWCSAYTDPSSITSITPGFITDAQGICGVNFDDTTETFAFTRPVIATPSTCSDATNDIWTVWVEPQTAYDSTVFKFSTDLSNNLIKVTGHSGQSANFSPVTFNVHFMLPDGTTSSFTVSTANMNSACVANPCETDTLSIDALVFSSPVLTYNLHNAAEPFTFTDAAAVSSGSLTSCGVLVWTITQTDGSPLDNLVFTLDLALKKIMTQSNDRSQVLTHQMTATVAYQDYSSVVPGTISFSIVIADPCAAATIDLSLAVANSVIPDAAPTYIIGDVEDTQTFDFSKASVLSLTSTCPLIEFKIVDADDPLEPEIQSSASTNGIFTFNQANSVLKTLTTDLTKAGTYNLKLKARFQGGTPEYTWNNSQNGQIAFSLTNPCQTAVITFNAAVNPFASVVTTFQVGDTLKVDGFTNTIATSSTDIYTGISCGDYTIDVYIDKGAGQNLASPLIYDVDSTNQQITYPKSLTLSDVGTWDVFYKVKLVQYASRVTTLYDSLGLQLVILNCNVVTNLDPQSMSFTGSQPPVEYTISQSLQTLTTSGDFTATPSNCLVSYTMSVQTATSVVSFDSLTKTFSFAEATDLSHTLTTSPFKKDYTVTLTGTSGIVTTQTAFKTFVMTVKNPCVDPAYNSIVRPSDFSQDYLINTDSVKIDYKAGFSVLLSQICGNDISFTVTSGLTSYITDDPSTNELSIYSADQSLAGGQSNDIVIQAFMTVYPNDVIAAPLTITVNFLKCEVTSVTMPSIANIEYTIGDPAQTVPFRAFQSLEAIQCRYEWTYSASLVEASTDNAPMADYITLDTQSLSFKIDSPTGSAQNLTVSLTGTLPNNQQYTTQFLAIFKDNTAVDEPKFEIPASNIKPEFKSPIVGKQTLDLSSGVMKESVVIGTMIDYEGDQFETKFTTQKDSHFITARVNSDNEWILDIDYDASVNKGLKNGDIFSFDFQVVQTQDDGSVYEKQYTVAVQIAGLEEATEVTNDYNFTQPEQVEKIDQPRPKLDLKKINQFGLVTVSFNETLFEVDNVTRINSTVLEVKVDSIDPDRQPLLGFTWTVISFAGQEMVIQLIFEDPGLISADIISGKDMLGIKVLAPTFFLAQETLRTVANETVIQMEVPPQVAMSQELEVQKMKAQADSIGESATFFASGSFVVQIALAGSLSLLWGLINALQLLTHFPFVNIKWAENAKMYHMALFELANLDIMPTDQLKEMLIEHEDIDGDQEPEEQVDMTQFLTDATIEAGYDNTDPVQSNFFNYILFGIAILSGLVLVLMRLFCWKIQKVKSCIMKLYEKLFFNFFLRTAFETFLETTLVYMIKFHDIGFSSGMDATSSSVAIASLAALILFSISLPVFLTCKKDQLRTPGFITKYGSLVKDLRDENFSTRFFYTLFTLRRLMVAALIVFMMDRPWLQVQLLCLSCSLQMIYIGYFNPFRIQWMNNLDLVNEYLVMTSTYFIFIYSDGFLLIPNPKVDFMVKDEHFQQELGWYHCYLLGFIVFVNVVVMSVIQGYSVFRKIKLGCMKKKHKKLMAEAERKRLIQIEIYKEFKDVDESDPPDLANNNDMRLKRSLALRNAKKSSQKRVTTNQINLDVIQEAKPIEENGSLPSQKAESILQSELKAESLIISELSDDTRAKKAWDNFVKAKDAQALRAQDEKNLEALEQYLNLHPLTHHQDSNEQALIKAITLKPMPPQQSWAAQRNIPTNLHQRTKSDGSIPQIIEAKAVRFKNPPQNEHKPIQLKPVQKDFRFNHDLLRPNNPMIMDQQNKRFAPKDDDVYKNSTKIQYFDFDGQEISKEKHMEMNWRDMVKQHAASAEGIITTEANQLQFAMPPPLSLQELQRAELPKKSGDGGMDLELLQKGENKSELVKKMDRQMDRLLQM